MRKILFFTSICLLTTFCSNAQSSSSDVVSTQGGYSKTDSYSLEWTLGETVATTFFSDYIYTQGFNQPFSFIKNKNAETNGNLFAVFAAPNPVRSVLNVSIKTASAYSVIITDIRGLRVFQKHANQDTQNLNINMRSLMPGVYMLQVYNEKNLVVSTTKVVKL